MRIAALDIGSNSFHLVVVESDALGNQRILTREKVMVRLARGVARTGKLDPEAFRLGLATLGDMAETIRASACDRVIACGTAALREAGDAPAFIEAAADLGIPIQIISGEEEARLIFLAVSRAVPFPEEPAALVDIGGGSTEITWVRGERVEGSLSIPWGLQRLGDAIPTADPPTADDLRRLRRFIRKVLKKALKRLPEAPPPVRLILGTSGTLQDLARGAAGGSAFSREQLLRFRRRLWHASAPARVSTLGVDPKRAELLHIGATWAAELLGWLGATQVQTLPVGLREGMIWEALRHGGQAIPALSERRHASITALAARLDPDPAHSHHVAALADQLFRDLRAHLELGDPDRELLEHAAHLHDIGLSVADKGHHKLGAFLIQSADLPGFWHKEIELIGQVVRFHRGKAPSARKHDTFAQLAPWHRQGVEKLAGLLRVADALDCRRRQMVCSLRLQLTGEEALLTLAGRDGLRAERQALEAKGQLLQKLLDRPLRVTVIPA